MQGFDWGQFIASTLTIVLLLLGALWWVKRNRMIGGTTGTDRRIHMLEAIPLSLKHKMVLASVSPGEVKTLHAWRKENSHVA